MAIQAHIIRPPTRRIFPVESGAWKIILFDRDNLYPQRMKLFLASSSTATGCVNIKAKHIRGFGFEEDFEEVNGRLRKKKAAETIDGRIVNSRGQTFQTIKRLIANSIAANRGFALHVNYNGLFEICEMTVIPWEFCRLGITDSYSFSNKVHVWEDWELVDWKQNRRLTPQIVDVFNPDPEIVASQVELAGGLSRYMGQILYWTEEGENKYVLSSFDSVLDHVRAEGSMAAFNANSAENNFNPGAIIGFPDMEAAEKAEIRALIREFQGTKNANSILALFGIVEGFEPIFKKFDQQNFDGRLKITGETAKMAIMELYNQTPALRGVAVPGKLGSADEIENAFELYNTHTEEERSDFSEIIRRLDQHAAPNIRLTESDNYNIIPLTFQGVRPQLPPNPTNPIEE